MGAWGVGVFENDDAGDWVYELEQSGDLAVLEHTLSGATAADEDGPDTRTAARALAAAEVVAALRGRPSDLPEDVTAWIATVRRPATPELTELARAAVERVRTHSELRDVSTEGARDGGAYWADLLADLLTRLE